MKRLILDLRGGLGNQLFQICGAMNYAEKLDMELIVDDSGIRRHSDKTRRNWSKKYQLEEMFNFQNLVWIHPLTIFTSTRRVSKKLDHPLTEIELNKIKEYKKDIRIRDWFYTKEYSLKRNVKALPPKNLSKKCIREVERVSRNNRIAAIHMRFGDFKATSWGVLPDRWYLDAINRITEQGIEHLEVYTDDIGEASRILSYANKTISLKFPEQKEVFLPHELLWLLSHYEVFISSNSSLSWWASFLEPNGMKQIICTWQESLKMDNWELV